MVGGAMPSQLTPYSKILLSTSSASAQHV